jgi:hypothetical protein
MKMVKSLLLGSAAGIVAIAGAQAADLPVKAKPVEYVKVCSIYGAGFFYIPGTDSCIKIGGYVRAEWGINSNAGSNGPYINGANGRDNREVQNTNTRTRSVLSFDARTQTEYGTLRSYIRGGWEINSGDPNYRGIQYFDRAFIQFAGLTVGKTQSFFAFYANAINYTTEVGGGQFDVGLNLIAYTAQFGGGFSATISLEDNNHSRAGLYNAGQAGLAISALPANTSAAAFPTVGNYGGSQYPDIVANLRVDQPWGSAQISAALHDVYGNYQGTTQLTGAAGDATGYAVQAGAMFNLPFAQGDAFWVQGTYAKGAAAYLGFVPFVHFAGQFAMYSGGPDGAPGPGCGTGAGAPGACGTVGLAWGLDGVYNGASNVQLTEGWSINAAIEHYWTPALRTSVFGHYTSLSFPGDSGFVGGVATGTASGAKGAFCTGVGFGAGTIPGTTVAVGGTCDPSFKVLQLGTRTIWSPVRNLDIGVEVLYTRLDQNMVGNWQLPASGFRPAGGYAAADQDTWGGIIRFQRNFWP